jgi:hypothetical protein
MKPCQVHLGHRTLEPAVRGQAHPAPGRKRRQDALEQRREDLVQVLLDHVGIGLQRAHLRAERQPGDRVHRVAHQVGLEVDGVLLARAASPARRKPLRNALEGRKVVFHVRRVETGHHHAPLAPPDLAAGCEQARQQAHLGADLVQPCGAAEAVRPVAQQRGHRLVVSHDDDLALEQLELVERPEFLGPGFELEVKPRRVDLQRVAEPGQAARAGQVFEAAQRAGRRHRVRGGVWICGRHCGIFFHPGRQVQASHGALPPALIR